MLSELCGVPVETDARLRELEFGAREGLTWAEAWEKMPDGMQAWIDGDETKIPGSETHHQAGERFALALRDLVEDLGDDETLVVVAHGGVARVGACSFLGFPVETWGSFGGLNNCSWSVLQEEEFRGRRRGGGSSSGTPAHCPSRSCPTTSAPVWERGRRTAKIGDRSSVSIDRWTRGYGAVGSALPWHGRGQGFESP